MAKLKCLFKKIIIEIFWQFYYKISLKIPMHSGVELIFFGNKSADLERFVRFRYNLTFSNFMG